MDLFQDLYLLAHPMSSSHWPQPNKHTNLQYGMYYPVCLGFCSYLETDFSIFQALCLRSTTTHLKITTILFCLQEQRYVWFVSIDYKASSKMTGISGTSFSQQNYKNLNFCFFKSQMMYKPLPSSSQNDCTLHPSFRDNATSTGDTLPIHGCSILTCLNLFQVAPQTIQSLHM